MSLRQQAAADLLTILEDSDGFGWDITVRNPSGTELAMKGFSTDIGQSIDPNTGVPVASRQASVALPIARLLEANHGVPTNITDKGSKPWLVTFDDVHGRSATFKVSNAMPDTALGVVVCLLEAYKT